MDPIFFWLIALLLVALLLIGLLCFPETGDALYHRCCAALRRVRQRAERLQGRSSNRVQQASQQLRGDTSYLLGKIRRHRLLLLSLTLLLTVPPLLVIGLHRHVMLDGFDQSLQDDPDAAMLVAGLLRGERLVPPPALPPDIFVTREVERIRPDLDSASRDWVKLDLGFRQRLLAVFRIMKERYGYDMALIEGYRSPERQNELAAKGGNVTNARGYQSYHQYGLAADCGFYRDGKLVISESDPWAMRGYQLYGNVAVAAGLVWGGRWKMMDLGHVEWHKPDAGPHHRH